VRAAGVDIWKGRWIVVVLDGRRFEFASVADSMDEVLELVAGTRIVGVDVPIGLPLPGQKRPADELARAAVGPRWHSVFLAPSEDLIAADSPKAANEIARSEGRPGISAQAFALRASILEVAPVAARDTRLFEVHPEVSFVRANGDKCLQWSKTTWNGIRQRLTILESHGIEIPDDLGPAGAAGAADVLDASIAAWSARRIAKGAAESLPPGHERIGAIWS